MTVELVGFCIAASTYLGLIVLLLRGWRGRAQGLAFICAAAATLAWAAVGAAAAVLTSIPPALVGSMEIVHVGAWLWTLYTVLQIVAQRSSWRWRPGDPLCAIGTTLLLAVFAVSLLPLLDPLALSGLSSTLFMIGRLGLAVFGLVLIESILKTTAESNVWTVKHMLIGLGVLFALDLCLYSEALLLREMGELAASVRSFVTAFVVPLLLVSSVRVRELSFDVGISRRIAVQTTALVGSGIYLMAIAGAGYLLRGLGMEWGPVMQIVLLVGALLVLITLLSSRQLQVRLRLFLVRNFFTSSYDYREEWLRLVRTMSGGDDGLSLYERTIKAMIQPLECSGGALYLRDRSDAFRQSARLNWRSAKSVPELPRRLIDRLSDGRTVLELSAAAGSTIEGLSDDLQGFDAPWLAIALRARGRMLGVMILGHARAERMLTWEDRDVIEIFAFQIGSYIAEEQLTRAVTQAQRFEQMSKRFSFVAHDLKNVVSQLAPILRQAKRHGDNPEFLQDVLVTVSESVEKMQATLLRLREGSGKDGVTPVRVDLSDIVRDLLRRKSTPGGAVRSGEVAPQLAVHANPVGLGAVLDNLVQNAVEATGQLGGVVISSWQDGKLAVVEVKDDGPGMSDGFVQDHLFQPFASTKTTGFGIGMYQCREWIESWGGRLEIESQVGLGTTARVLLPLVQDPEPATAFRLPDGTAAASSESQHAAQESAS